MDDNIFVIVCFFAISVAAKNIPNALDGIISNISLEAVATSNKMNYINFTVNILLYHHLHRIEERHFPKCHLLFHLPERLTHDRVACRL